MLKLQNMGIAAVKDKTASYIESWIQHIRRMAKENITKKMLINHEEEEETLVIPENGKGSRRKLIPITLW
jgi:hypothetical protein